MTSPENVCVGRYRTYPMKDFLGRTKRSLSLAALYQYQNPAIFKMPFFLYIDIVSSLRTPGAGDFIWNQEIIVNITSLRLFVVRKILQVFIPNGIH